MGCGYLKQHLNHCAKYPIQKKLKMLVFRLQFSLINQAVASEANPQFPPDLLFLYIPSNIAAAISVEVNSDNSKKHYIVHLVIEMLFNFITQ